MRFAPALSGSNPALLMATINISLPDSLRDWMQKQIQDPITTGLKSDINQLSMVDTAEVYNENQSDNLIVSPKKHSWDAFFNSTSAFDEDFLNDREF